MSRIFFWSEFCFDLPPDTILLVRFLDLRKGNRFYKTFHKNPEKSLHARRCAKLFGIPCWSHARISWSIGLSKPDWLRKNTGCQTNVWSPLHGRGKRAKQSPFSLTMKRWIKNDETKNCKIKKIMKKNKVADCQLAALSALRKEGCEALSPWKFLHPKRLRPRNWQNHEYQMRHCQSWSFFDTEFESPNEKCIKTIIAIETLNFEKSNHNRLKFLENPGDLDDSEQNRWNHKKLRKKKSCRSSPAPSHFVNSNLSKSSIKWF